MSIKKVTVTLEFFPGYNVNPPCFILSYIHPDTKKEVIEIAAKVPDERFYLGMARAYSRFTVLREAFMVEGFKAEIVKHNSVDTVIAPVKGVGCLGKGLPRYWGFTFLSNRDKIVETEDV